MAMIDFSGLEWTVKESTTPVGPGPNLFSAHNITVDAQGLHLAIGRSRTAWTCAEVIARGRFGYGTYGWTVAADLTRLDRHAVLGLFTWSYLPAHAHREIDIEFARWGVLDRSDTGLFTVQAGSTPNSAAFTPAGATRSVHTMVWSPGRVMFSSFTGGTASSWTYAGHDVPVPGGDVTPRINLWLYRGESPAQPQRVTISHFSYTEPLPRVQGGTGGMEAPEPRD